MQVDTLSWFSTTLFVLATGIRPWGHLVQRLQQRTHDLQDAVELPLNEERHRTLDERLEYVMQRLDSMERTLLAVKSKSAKIEPLQEVCDDLTEALGDLERVVHRHERRTELARVSHNNRLAVLETNMEKVEEQARHNAVSSAHVAQYRLENTIYTLILRAFLFVRHIPRKIQAMTQYHTRSYSSNSKFATTPPTSPKILHSPDDSTQYFNGTPLETILEAADSDSEGTYVSEKEGSLHPTFSATVDSLKRRPARKLSRGSVGGKHRRGGSGVAHTKIFDIVAAIASWPYRLAVSVLSLFTPSSVRNLVV